jgi:mRNA-degrading endonuclease toxin of MazEF toxin-antitoxin module
MQITNEIIEKFVEWAKVKIKLQLATREVYFKEGQIWWISFGQNIGLEVNGKNQNFERPGLIFKKFSGYSMIVLPIYSHLKYGDLYYHFTNDHNQSNIINLSQIRFVSSKRLIRHLGKVDELQMEEIKERIRKII